MLFKNFEIILESYNARCSQNEAHLENLKTNLEMIENKITL